jgi:hypothetical protein
MIQSIHFRITKFLFSWSDLGDLNNVRLQTILRTFTEDDSPMRKRKALFHSIQLYENFVNDLSASLSRLGWSVQTSHTHIAYTGFKSITTHDTLRFLPDDFTIRELLLGCSPPKHRLSEDSIVHGQQNPVSLVICSVAQCHLVIAWLVALEYPAASQYPGPYIRSSNVFKMHQLPEPFS